MLENIKITANNINNTNNNLNRPKMPESPENLIPFDILDPTRVNKPLKQDGAQLNNQENIAHNPYSVFEKFLETINVSPTLIENMRKVLFSKQFINSNIKNDPLLKAFFEEFVKDINMDNEKMLDFIKFQHNNYTKFSGEFFNFIRNAVKLNPNEDFKNLVCNFLKSYDCYLSTDEITNAIVNTLKQISSNIPDMLKDTLTSLTDKLILNSPDNSADINLDLLKNEIIPYLAKYIAKTNDFGTIRDYISALIHNVVRLENGQKDNFLNNVDNLFNYLKYSFNLSEKDMSELKYALISSFRGQSDLKNNSLDFMFKLIDSGINDTKNYMNKTTFEGIEESFLLSNNVQIPLIHIFLPVNYNGVFMFSELWINKEINDDEDKTNNNSKNNTSSETYKLFLTFEINNIGYFETLVLCQNNKLSIEIFVPNLLKNHTGKIKSDITSIVKKNNIDISNVVVNECIKQRKFYEVFNVNYVKERGINVIA